MNIRPSKFFTRMVLFGILLGTLPVLILGSFSYYKSAEISREKVIKGNISLLYQTQMRVEPLLTGIDNSATQLLSSSIIQTMRDYSLSQTEFQYFNELSNRMHLLQSYDNGIQDVTLINFSRDWILNNRLLTSFSTLPNKESLEQYTRHPRASFWQREISPERISQGMSTTPGVNLVKKLPVNNQSGNSAGLFIVKIPSMELSKLLMNGDSTGSTMILDEDYRTIASVTESDIGKDLSEFGQAFLGTKQEKEGYFETPFEGEQMGIAFRKSDYNGWFYLTFIPVHKITKESGVIGWFSISISLAVVLVILALSFFASRRMYHPIQKLVDAVRGLPLTHFPEDPKSDEFTFIGGRVQNMKDTQIKLESELQSQYRFLREFFILKLFQGGVKKQEAEEKIAIYGYLEEWKLLNVMTIQIDTLSETRYEEKDRDLLLYAIGNVVSELIPANRRLSPILFGDFQTTLIGSAYESREETKADLFEQAIHIQSAVKNVLGLAVSIGVSSCFTDIIRTHQAYQESVEALKYRMGLSEESILLIEDIQPGGERQSAPFPEQLEAELIDAVKLTDRDKADGLLDAFLESVFAAEPDFRVYQMTLVRLLMDLEKIIEPYGTSLNLIHVGDDSVFERLFAMKTAKEIKHWFRYTILEAIIRLLEEQRNSQYKKISEKMLEIIHEMSHTDLTLESCAKLLNYHPNYLKRVFRMEVGVNFSDYLTQHRMTLAKKWLLETDMKVSEIAEKIGYSSPQNFIRYFRKIEGMTPGQYREKTE